MRLISMLRREDAMDTPAPSSVGSLTLQCGSLGVRLSRGLPDFRIYAGADI